jgi:hypothetical protein
VHFTAQTSSDGVIERDFTVGEVPGVLWSPASGAERAPLVLLCHGGGRDKKAPAMTSRAYRLVTDLGSSNCRRSAPTGRLGTWASTWAPRSACR